MIPRGRYFFIKYEKFIIPLILFIIPVSSPPLFFGKGRKIERSVNFIYNSGEFTATIFWKKAKNLWAGLAQRPVQRFGLGLAQKFWPGFFKKTTHPMILAVVGPKVWAGVGPTVLAGIGPKVWAGAGPKVLVGLC